MDSICIQFSDGVQSTLIGYDYRVGIAGELDLFDQDGNGQIVMTYAPHIWESIVTLPSDADNV